MSDVTQIALEAAAIRYWGTREQKVAYLKQRGWVQTKSTGAYVFSRPGDNQLCDLPRAISWQTAYDTRDFQHLTQRFGASTVKAAPITPSAPVTPKAEPLPSEPVVAVQQKVPSAVQPKIAPLTCESGGLFGPGGGNRRIKKE
jgi:hypothetical protein